MIPEELSGQLNISIDKTRCDYVSIRGTTVECDASLFLIKVAAQIQIPINPKTDKLHKISQSDARNTTRPGEKFLSPPNVPSTTKTYPVEVNVHVEISS